MERSAGEEKADLPVASSSYEHLVEWKLSVEVFLYHIHPFRISRVTVQLLPQKDKSGLFI